MLQPKKSIHYLWTNPNLPWEMMWSVTGGFKQKLDIFNEHKQTAKQVETLVGGAAKNLRRMLCFFIELCFLM